MVPVTVIMTAGLALITFLTKAMLVRTPGLLLKNLWLTGQHLPVKPILQRISPPLMTLAGTLCLQHQVVLK